MVAPPQSPRLHNMAWLLQLRWLALAGQAAAIGFAGQSAADTGPVTPLYAVIVPTALSNAALTWWLRRGPNVEEWMPAGVMALDVLLLSVLLYYAGGPSNPFTVLFLVNVTLAAVVLAPRYSWILAGLSSACFLALFVLPAVSSGSGMDAHHHHESRHAAMSLHLKGMWVAFLVAATAIAYFVTRVRRDLEAQRSATAIAQMRALRSEKLASLATLAAGAAHELSTPLGTIAITAKELQRKLEDSSPQTAEDMRLIREEVDRCKHILTQMTSDAGESAGEAFRRISLPALAAHMLDGVLDRKRVRVDVPQDESVRLPVRAFSGAMRGLLNNALQASNDPVTLSGHVKDHHLRLEIEDRGTGMPPEVLAQVGEPFFTTKEPGRGMGLGVFLARALTERLGGSLELHSEPGHGTTARVVLPHDPEA